MVNPSVITKRVEQIEKHLERIRPFASLPQEAFLKDNVAQDVVEYNLFQIVNHLIDIFQHTVVDEEYGFPETAYEAAQILFEKGILSPPSLPESFHDFYDCFPLHVLLPSNKYFFLCSWPYALSLMNGSTLALNGLLKNNDFAANIIFMGIDFHSNS